MFIVIIQLVSGHFKDDLFIHDVRRSEDLRNLMNSKVGVKSYCYFLLLITITMTKKVIVINNNNKKKLLLLITKK